jgi:hypothetical protein
MTVRDRPDEHARRAVGARVGDDGVRVEPARVSIIPTPYARCVQ